jgi:hypothetical protein
MLRDPIFRDPIFCTRLFPESGRCSQSGHAVFDSNVMLTMLNNYVDRWTNMAVLSCLVESFQAA